jgi:hypothetical protein
MARGGNVSTREERAEEAREEAKIEEAERRFGPEHERHECRLNPRCPGGYIPGEE